MKNTAVEMEAKYIELLAYLDHLEELKEICTNGTELKTTDDSISSDCKYIIELLEAELDAENLGVDI